MELDIKILTAFGHVQRGETRYISHSYFKRHDYAINCVVEKGPGKRKQSSIWRIFQNSAMASVALGCSFAMFSKKTCGASSYFKSLLSVVPLKSCNKNTKSHLCSSFKTSNVNIEEEWQLILARVGQQGSDCETLTICPLHRDEFGLRWRPSKTCKHPLHNNKQKPTRGVTLKIATEIQQIWGKIVEPGQGK